MTEKDLGVDARKLLETLKGEHKIKTIESLVGEYIHPCSPDSDAREKLPKEWVSVETVTAHLQKILAEKTVAEEKNVEYAKLVAAQAKEYAEKNIAFHTNQEVKEQALRKLLKYRPAYLKSYDDRCSKQHLLQLLNFFEDLAKQLEKVFDESC
jgi:hypothetical protein